MMDDCAQWKSHLRSKRSWPQAVLEFIYRKKVNFPFILSIKRGGGGGGKLFSSHFSIILLGSARLVGIILGINIVCT